MLILSTSTARKAPRPMRIIPSPISRQNLWIHGFKASSGTPFAKKRENRVPENTPQAENSSQDMESLNDKPLPQTHAKPGD
jgi:hypothetical protein